MSQEQRKITGNSGIQFYNWANINFKNVVGINYETDQLYIDYVEFASKSSFRVLRKKTFRRYLKAYFKENHLNMKTITFSLTSKRYSN